MQMTSKKGKALICSEAVFGVLIDDFAGTTPFNVINQIS